MGFDQIVHTYPRLCASAAFCERTHFFPRIGGRPRGNVKIVYVRITLHFQNRCVGITHIHVVSNAKWRCHCYCCCCCFCCCRSVNDINRLGIITCFSILFMRIASTTAEVKIKRNKEERKHKFPQQFTYMWAVKTEGKSFRVRWASHAIVCLQPFMARVYFSSCLDMRCARLSEWNFRFVFNNCNCDAHVRRWINIFQQPWKYVPKLYRSIEWFRDVRLIRIISIEWLHLQLFFKENSFTKPSQVTSILHDKSSCGKQ